MSLFVTAAAGTEKALKEELRELGLRRVRADRGGVRADGGRDEAGLVCLGTRIGVRVLIEVTRFACPHEDALYDGVSAVEWERWITPRHTLAVTSVSRDSRLRHTNYIAQRTKDAIVDRQRRREGARSSVERHDPDLGIFVHLKRDEAAVFLDASGGSLHARGWRARGGEAPLKETLAAALVRMSGWDREAPLVDPMCGSGTLVIEADLFARDVPPQSERRRFGLERWADFDAPAARRMREARAAVAARARARGPDCAGYDRDPRAIGAARENASRARSTARFEVSAIDRLALPRAGGLVIVNPPYGERLEASWREVGRALSRLEGSRIALLAPDDAPRDLLRRAPAHAHRVYNGRIPCHLLVWEPR
ncbi:MAG: THUMP domain-containing protein [Sandaracinaceae bacterium]|nr:THUMP domain-containing protein [Sandaracinaceae bacterium]